MTTKEQRDELRKAAGAATPGEWIYYYKSKYAEHQVSVLRPNSTMRAALFADGCQTTRPEQDAKFIALANPQTILALLDQLDSQQSASVDASVPVAWYMSGDPDGEQTSFTTSDGILASSYSQLGWKQQPLYLHPPAAEKVK